jgi:biopolymer transport protein ExbB
VGRDQQSGTRFSALQFGVFSRLFAISGFLLGHFGVPVASMSTRAIPVAAVTAMVWSTLPQNAVAQEDDAEPAAPAAPAAGAGGAAAGVDPLAARKAESFLGWMIRASGPFGFLIMLVSFVMVALIMMDVLQLRRQNYLPTAFIEQFEQKLNAKDYAGAYESAKGEDALIGRVLAAGMVRLNRGYEEVQAGMQEVNDDEAMALSHKLSYLALVGSIAPMLGLLGTVQGMVSSFQVIATSTTAPKPYELADGIATALFTTLEGLIVAIPAIIAYAIFKNWAERYIRDVESVSSEFMGRLSSAAKAAVKPAGGAAPASAPAAPQA